MTKISTPRGTSDILPEEISAWQSLEKKVRLILENYSYREIRTPIFEETALFVRSLGTTTDIVQKQMLNLAGDKKEGFSLRPEGTASIARSYIEHDFDKKEQLSKLYYLGAMFRGERPQKGRLRQFHQIGVEAIGPNSASPYLDAEVIALSVELLKGLGVEGFKLKINTLGSAEDKENFSKLLRQNLSKHKKELCEECQNRLERNVFRILDCKNPQCKNIVDGLDIKGDYLSKESREYYDNVKEALNSLSISFEESSKLVRGLDYYTHTVFEISHEGLGSQDALGAGGRYNDLISQLGGPKVDAIGFALGLERILLALSKDKMQMPKPLDFFLIALDENSLRRGFLLLQELRSKNISGEMNYRASSMKSQMRQADKSGARFVLILGEDELKSSSVTIKDMKSGEQNKVSLDNISGELKKNL